MPPLRAAAPIMIAKRSLLILATFLLAVLLYVDRICISTAKDGITQDLGLTDKQCSRGCSRT